MLWVAAFLSLIIWLLGMASGFLGFGIHLFLFFTLISGLAALLPPTHEPLSDEDDVQLESTHANFVPATTRDAANASLPYPAEEQKLS